MCRAYRRIYSELDLRILSSLKISAETRVAPVFMKCVCMLRQLRSVEIPSRNTSTK